MKIADYTAKVLSDRGVRYVFGVPGGPSIPYMEAWRNKGIEFILTSHEASAAMMAGITSRLTGVTGVCHATFGPGAVNLASGVGCSLLDRMPVLAFTSEVPDRMAGRTTQMGIDHQQLFRSLTKSTMRLTQAGVAEALKRSLTIADEELPGPVHIGLPSDIALKEAGDGKAENAASCPEGFTAGKPRSTGTGSVKEAVRLLKESKKPLIALGLTAARLGISPMLGNFLKTTSVPVVMTPMAKGILHYDDQCYCGVLFHALSDRLRQVTGACDLIIGIGYDPVEYNYESWMPDVSIVHFGTTDVDMPQGVRTVVIKGYPERWFEVLSESGMSGDFLSGRGVDTAKREIEDIFSELATRWGPVNVMKVMREELSAETILTCDVGSHLHLAGQYWQPPEPDRMLITNGWSTMGFGIPAGIAAALNIPDSTVVAVTGDGGFLMSAGEIMTARRYNLNMKVVVIADRELNLIKVKQSWYNTDQYGTGVINGDMFGSDSFLGVPVFDAAEDTAFRTAIRSALAFKGPAIICATVPGEDYYKLIVRQ